MEVTSILKPMCKLMSTDTSQKYINEEQWRGENKVAWQSINTPLARLWWT